MSDPARPTLHHVNLKTHRLDEMVAWYSEVLGMQVVYRFSGGAWLSNDAANHRLALLADPRWPDDPDKLEHTGMHHIAYEFSEIDALLDSFGRLKVAGILPHACLDHGMTLSFYYADPDDNSVELQCDVYGDWTASKEFMLHSPRFAADPVGVSIDPDALVEARRLGADRAELHRRAYSGEFEPQRPLDLRLPAPMSGQ